MNKAILLVIMYDDWFNNFLTLEKFANYYSISQKKAIWVIKKGKELRESLITINKMRRSN